MINLPNGATPHQFVAGFVLLTVVSAVAINVAVWTAKSVWRRVKRHRAHRAHVRRLAEIYGVEL